MVNALLVEHWICGDCGCDYDLEVEAVDCCGGSD